MRIANSDDDWCEVCGESIPCPCDDAEDGWFAEDEEYYEDWLDQQGFALPPVPISKNRTDTGRTA